MQKVARTFALGAAIALSSCGKPHESIADYRGNVADIKMRTREYYNSGIKNVDICVVAKAAVPFPSDKSQCIMSGYDLSGLEIGWKSSTDVVISFKCGRVSTFSNYAVVPDANGKKIQVHARLMDSCSGIGSI